MVKSIEVRQVSSVEHILSHRRDAYIGWDTEGALMDEATPVPRLSLFQYAYRGQAYLVNYKHANDAFKEMLSYMLANRVIAVAHHLVHDTMSMLVNDPSCADLLIECYDQGLFEDTLLNEKLDDFARGEYEN